MSFVFHRSLTKTLPTVASGAGIRLTDTDGKEYVDASGGAAVSCLGHSDEKVIAAVREQVGKLAFAHTSFFTNQPAEDLARVLFQNAPEGFGEGKAIFVGSGSEAVEVALKLARQVQIERGKPERCILISREGAYHGNTLGALAAGGHAVRRAPYAPLLMEVPRISAAYAYRGQKPGESEEDYGLRCANELEAAILRVGPEKVAGFIAETVGGATLGVTLPPRGYFRRIAEICAQYGVLLIADEVMCGMGRCGSLFAISQEGVCPDIITIAKGLGAGYQPVAATLAAERVIAPIRAGSGKLMNGHTYMSHAVSCAAALAVLRRLTDDGLVDRVATVGPDFGARLTATFGEHLNVGDIRGRGLFWALELVKDRATRSCFSPSDDIAERIRSAAMAEGLICYPSAGTADGSNGDHVVLAPPFIATDAELDDIVMRLERAIRQVLPLQG